MEIRINTGENSAINALDRVISDIATKPPQTNHCAGLSLRHIPTISHEDNLLFSISIGRRISYFVHYSSIKLSVCVYKHIQSLLLVLILTIYNFIALISCSFQLISATIVILILIFSVTTVV